MSLRNYKSITPEVYKKVLDYFYNNNDNRTSVISNELYLNVNCVNYILDMHLKYKNNAYVDESTHRKKKKPIKIRVYDWTHTLIGEFKSYKDAISHLGISRNSLEYKFRKENSHQVSIFHNRINKLYTYVKII